ncbi:MAG: TylF/MycF/NovP-related O-methyltransferase [Cyanobacteria bacterium P01_F01_bin.143]
MVQSKPQQFDNSLKLELGTAQYIYDAFNNFIFSSDTRVLGKLLARAFLFSQVKDVPGDIVECGVFKGSGVLTWLKLKKIFVPNAFKKVIGFDYFDTNSLLNSLSGNDKVRMTELFGERHYEHDGAATRFLEEKIALAGFSKTDYELVKGDISQTAPEFADQRPGFRISLLYIDLDIEKPTYDTLSALWDRLSIGGIVAFDEYAVHQWSEATGADRFFQDKNIQIKTTTDYFCPIAYVVKGS